MEIITIHMNIQAGLEAPLPFDPGARHPAADGKNLPWTMPSAGLVPSPRQRNLCF